MRTQISLVPHTGIQFVSEHFNFETTPRFARNFVERHVGDEITLHPFWRFEDPDGEPPARMPGDGEPYTITKQRALEPFLDQWVPVPYLRLIGTGLHGQDRFDKGPSNWVRVRVTKNIEGSNQPGTHQVTLAFDTETLPPPMPNRAYTAPSSEDAQNAHEFRFVPRMDANAWFVSDPKANELTGDIYDHQAWVMTWLKDIYFEMLQAKRPGRAVVIDENDPQFEFAARYFTFLEFLEIAIEPPTVKFIDTVSADPPAFVDVDLILDIGNSRTCGLLIERFPNERDVKLSNSMVLELRDLGQPDIIYSKPFESHVELVAANFGREDLSRLSGRSKAFFWPSPVRVGPEAARYRSKAEGTEAISGMSSPKRYLWDNISANQDWKFNGALGNSRHAAAPIENAIFKCTNRMGDVLSFVAANRSFFSKKVTARQDRDVLDEPASRFAYSRSAFFSFMVAEIVWQAMVMINNPTVRSRRGQKDLPRRLQRIYFTMPTSMPVHEQRIMKARAQSGINLIWDLMGWTRNAPPHYPAPQVKLDLDEASCVHFVYLYSEIARKFGGSITKYFELVGRKRPLHDPDRPSTSSELTNSLRIASIDVGGGTTDLMITTYYPEEDRAIQPIQLFREGFRIAGDDILRQVIQRHVLPSIEKRLTASGLQRAREFLKSRFEGEQIGMAEQERHLRRQFTLRVLVPLGLSILRIAEKANIAERQSVLRFTLAELLKEGDQSISLDARFTSYLESAASENGANKFKLEECLFELDMGAIGTTCTAVLDTVFRNFGEVINWFDCDVVLLTGRPTCLPDVIESFRNQLEVSPDRIIAMNQYLPGQWYPFSGHGDGRIDDPKTTAAVGCMLCALADHQLTNFTLYSKGLRMRSTAGYIGPLEQDFRLLKKNEIFKNQSPVKPGDIAESKVLFHAKMRIGFRQLPFERWTASPLYMLQLEGANVSQIKLPISVILEREAPDDVDEEAKNFLDRALEAEAQKEELRISEAIDSNDAPITKTMSLSLHTLQEDGGHWLDTGVLTVS